MAYLPNRFFNVADLIEIYMKKSFKKHNYFHYNVKILQDNVFWTIYYI